MKLRAVLLDAGGTLFHLGRPVGEIYAETAGRYGREADGREIHRRYVSAFESRSAAWADQFASVTPDVERAWWRDLVADVFAPEGVPRFEAFFDELHALFGRPDMWRVYPEVKRCLARLRAAEMKLAVVSNWDRRLERLCVDMGIAGYFDAIVASAVAGSSKPSAAIFRIALDRLEAAAGEAVHVGDSWKDDVCGARGCGIAALWLRRGDFGGGGAGASGGGGAADVPVVANLDEVLSRVLS